MTNPVAPVMDEVEFTEYARTYYGTQNPTCIVSVVEPLALEIDDEELGRISLSKPYTKYLENMENVDPILEEYLNAFRNLETVDADFEEVAPYVLPILKLRSFFQHTVPEGADETDSTDSTPCTLEHSDSLIIAFVIDKPDSPALQYIISGDLTAWQLTQEELYQCALNNLRNLSETAIEKIPASEEHSVYKLVPEDNYSATRILLDEVLAMFDEVLGENYTIAIPANECLVAAPTRSDDLLEWLSTDLQNEYRDSRRPSPKLFSALKSEVIAKEIA